MIKKTKLINLLWGLDILVFSISFLLLHYRKFSVFIPTENYFYLYLIFMTFWITFSLYYNKINVIIDKTIWLVIRIVFWSSVMSLLFVVIAISFSDLWSISRKFIATFTIIIILYEILITFVVKIFIDSKIILQNNSEDSFEEPSSKKFYLKWLIPGIIALLMIYIFIVYFNTGSFKYNILNEQNVLILISAWGLATLLTNRYKEPNTINHYYEIAPYIKSSILTFLFLTFFYYSLRISTGSINLIYQAGFLHSGLEILTFFLYFFGESKKNGSSSRIAKRYKIKNGQETLKINNGTNQKYGTYTENELLKSIDTFGFKYGKDLSNFIWNSIKSEKISKTKVTILNTSSTINIELLFNESKELLANIHPLNDFRRINEYFLTSYSKLESGGIFVGSFIPLENIQNHLRKQMPHFLFSIILPFYFIFHRVFPKLAITKRVYFILTRGKNRVISKSEILGRLSFCGYEIINEISLGDQFYFVCKKKKTVSDEKFPSYGPIVKLKRVGYLGKPVYIYKFRTMYPYSEFIQGDIYEKYRLDHSGKIKGDYRITSWGKIFRKYFIDEIPQLYNWIKGDLKLMGVRALSEHYYNLYPKALREKRVKFKPGLIPPFYADLPKSFDEILRSEEIYLNKKHKAPFMTDLKYFIRSITNILFSGARSK